MPPLNLWLRHRNKKPAAKLSAVVPVIGRNKRLLLTAEENLLKPLGDKTQAVEAAMNSHVEPARF